VFTKENIIEIGSMSEYPKNRYDSPGALPVYDFWSASFVIKYLPTPDFVVDNFPPIVVTFMRG
jgi:hypothetical protein